MMITSGFVRARRALFNPNKLVYSLMLGNIVLR